MLLTRRTRRPGRPRHPQRDRPTDPIHRKRFDGDDLPVLVWRDGQHPFPGATQIAYLVAQAVLALDLPISAYVQ